MSDGAANGDPTAERDDVTMSEDITHESIRCPHCGTTFAERMAACPQCDFSLAILDAQMPPPPLQAGPVNDWAGVLTAEDAQRLIQACQAIHQAAQAELSVVTVETTTPLKPAEYVFWLANHWDIGGPENRGLLILLALHERRIESEVGYGLEPLLSDIESELIIQEHVVPYLYAGQYAEGLYQAVNALGQALVVKHKAAARKRWRDRFV
jgi:uncharacterized protein